MTSSSERTKLAWTGFQGKTLWDWLRFLTKLIGAIAIPLVVLYATNAFTTQQQYIAAVQHRNELDAARAQHQNELSAANDQQRETILKAYLDDMSSLLLNHNLHNAAPADEVRNIARVRTLTTLRQLDGARKGILLLFLHEADLISSPNPVILLAGDDLHGAVLHGADLGRADLHRAVLQNADLQNANLAGANLRGAYLHCANLHNAVLHNADLSQAVLIRANLDEADLGEADLHSASLIEARLHSAGLTGARLHNAIMPNRSIHP